MGNTPPGNYDYPSGVPNGHGSYVPDLDYNGSIGLPSLGYFPIDFKPPVPKKNASPQPKVCQLRSSDLIFRIKPSRTTLRRRRDLAFKKNLK
jgi:hypothetical protein